MSLCDMLKQLMECTVEESKNAGSWTNRWQAARENRLLRLANGIYELIMVGRSGLIAILVNQWRVVNVEFMCLTA